MVIVVTTSLWVSVLHLFRLSIWFRPTSPDDRIRPSSRPRSSSGGLDIQLRITVIVLTTISYCVGNLIGPQLFFPKEAPRYQSGFASMLVCFSVQFLFIGISYLINLRENKRVRVPSRGLFHLDRMLILDSEIASLPIILQQRGMTWSSWGSRIRQM
jgi:hypothetical protein